MEVAPAIHSIPFATRAHMGTYPPNVYLITGSVASVLIDTGYGAKRAVGARLKYIYGAARGSLRYIVLTHPHPDHIGGALAIREATGAKIIVHPDAVDKLGKNKIPVDGTAENGDALDLGDIRLELLHTPGHTPNSICAYIGETQVLCSGDLILGMGTTVMRLPEGSLTQYLDSLRRLLVKPIKLICPGHGPVITEPGRKLEELIEHRQEREQQILSLLSGKSWTVRELVGEIYAELDRRLVKLARWQVEAHLDKLEREDRTEVCGKQYRAIPAKRT